jgi:IclR family transcriptional regulator, acetate operon repressor
VQIVDAERPAGTPPKRPRVQSVARASAILRAVAASESGLTAPEIASAVGLSRPTTYHLLHTLRDEGLLLRGGRREYRLGLGIGRLAEAFSRQLAPPEPLLPYLHALAARTGETAYVCMWSDAGLMLLSTTPGHHAVTVGTGQVGLAEYTHARAAGRVLLAQLSPEARAAFLARHPLEPRTPKTIVDPAEFERELDRVRAQGYAIDREEFSAGVCCVAAALDAGVAQYALSLSAPRERFEQCEEEYRTTILALAAAASRGAPPD